MKIFNFLFLLFISLTSGCITGYDQLKTSKTGIIGLNLGHPVQQNNTYHMRFMREYRAGLRYGYGLLSPIYTMNLNSYDEHKLDYKSRYIMEDVAYNALEKYEIFKEIKWQNDYVRGSFEVVGITRSESDKLCKQFVQKIYIAKELFLFDGIGCKRLDIMDIKPIWRVRQINRNILY